MRHITSTAAISASSTARPLAPVASPTASAVVTATQPVCTMASSRVSSKSRPWASVALARTALAAPTRPRWPSRALSGIPPNRSATCNTARPKSSRAAASALPRVSRASSEAFAVTAGGTRSSERFTTKRARRRAAGGWAIPSALPEPPDLFRRPAMSPRGGHVGISRDAVGRRPQLDQVEHLQAAVAKEPDPLADGQRELHRLVVGPLEPMEIEVVAQQAGVGSALAVRRAQRQQRAVLEEHQFATGAEQPRRLGDPAVGIAPDAGAVLRQQIGRAHV